MKTIDYILKESWVDLQELARLKKLWVCNWCGGKWGFNFSKNLESMPYFQSEKKQNLLWDMRTVCDIHDRDFYRGKTIKDFIVANYKWWLNLIQLFHWTTSWKRFIIFSLFFFWTTLFWRTYFINKW